MLHCYVLMCARSVTASLAPPQSQCPGKGPAHPTQRPTLLNMHLEIQYYPSAV
jgi:hypothetical protein